MEIKHITTPLTQEKLKNLKSGDSVLISEIGRAHV